MAKAVKIDITTTETIKPSSPTPQRLRLIKLSLYDQLSFAMSTPMLLFYPSLKDDDNNNKIHLAMKQQSQQLKSSLSKTLALFYPLAGRVKDNLVIECNDCGIEYKEAQVDCTLSEVFQQPDNDFLEKLIPIELNSAFTSAIVIQVNFFACGGLAIGVCISHKIADATSLGTFLMAWAARSLGSPLSPVLLPHFVSDTIIPSLEDFSLLPPPPPSIMEIIKCKTRRYVIDASNVSILRAKSASKRVQQPTRVEAVTAFLWKCLMNISRTKQSGCPRNSVLTQTVNLRRRFRPPLPQNYVGNLSGKFLVKTKVRSNIELAELVTLLREGLERTSDDIGKGGQTIDMAGILEFAKEFVELHKREDTDVYVITSLCGFPLYDIDFGWGKPTWAIVTNLVLKNFVVVTDTRDRKGIEVWMSLTEEDAALFESNQELLAFASMNPCVRSGGDNKVPVLDSSL